MKRILSACLVTLMLLAASPGHGASAQTPVATPAVTPDPFSLPVNHRVLRITEGNGFEYMTDAFARLLNTGYYQVDDGVVHPNTPSLIGDAYTEQGVQDLYIVLTLLVPGDPLTGDEATIGITVDIRLATFRDGETARRFVSTYQGVLEDMVALDPEASQDIAAIPDLPDYGEAMIGVTGTDSYYNVNTFERAGIQVPFARFIAQDGTTVASVKVTSFDPAFNDAVARELLATQLACLATDEVCVPAPLPDSVPYEPGTPAASPVAWRREIRA